MKNFHRFIVFFLLFLYKSSFSQITVGQWQDHLPYSQIIDLAEFNNKIYAATPYSLMILNKADNSVQKLSKVNGLSDIGISCLAYSSDANILVAGYTNGNIDLISENYIYNLSD
ncbi:MAG TPA: hypothetical protein EYP69_00715, partial [Bacteroidales bacterium]|nr:hypothetical protein [Bacteroidales bacterium]